MSYALGIDLGTTFTAAAVWRDGRAEIASLGGRTAAIPSVVLLRDDETLLTGEPANRRALTEPHRVAREFKRRLGDTTPILLAGTPYSAEALTAKLLRAVVDEVSAREGEQPDRICVSHPANWGPYKIDLLHQAVRLSNLEYPVTFTTEPEAAAAFYAQDRHLEPGALVAVYDLGGGTFDSAVLRKTETGFAILGHPEGIERLGGIDFDAAVFHHVSQALDGRLAELDENDYAAIAAVGRLREECVEAKEALSTDTDVSIPVLLPNLSTEVRLTRTELESMVRPALYESIEALRRALRSAGVTADELHSVLLVGGSSRMPIVSQMVGAELGRPVAVDAHPKHAIALGAAFVASGEVSTSREVRVLPSQAARAEPPVAVPEPPVAVAEPPVAVPESPAAVAEPPVAVAEPPVAVSEPAAALTTQLDRIRTDEPAVAEETVAANGGEPAPDTVRRGALLDRTETEPADADVAGVGVADAEPPDLGRSWERISPPVPWYRRLPVPAWIGLGAVLVVAVVVAVIAFSGGGGGGGGGGGANTDVALAVARTLPVGRLPDGIVVDQANTLWVASPGADQVAQIDPASGNAGPVAIGPEPLALAVTDDGAVWVTVRAGARIARIDPASRSVTDQVEVGSRPAAFGVGAGSLWVVAVDGNSIDRVDPNSKEVVASIPVPSPAGIAITDDAAWVSRFRANVVTKIDLATNRVVGEVKVGERPDALASDGEALWVTNRGEGTLSRIDLGTEQVTDTIEVGTGPAGIAIDGNRVWVIDNEDNTLVLVDRSTRQVVTSVQVGRAPLGLALRDSSVWVTLSEASSIAEVAVTPR